MDLKKGSIIGPFEIVQPIKRGGMAEVYLAKSDRLEDLVALKISRRDSNPVFRNALRLEAEILEKLDHPFILKILPLPLGAKTDPFVARAIAVEWQPWYYAMEYLRGDSLGELLERQKVLPLDLASAICVFVVNALFYLHNRKIYHLDVKPENIIFRHPLEKGARIEPVLIDFGVASRSRLGDASGGSIMSMAPEYLERAQGSKPPEMVVDLTKVDVYSLGVTMYRMVTGHYPFGGKNERTLTNAILHTVPPPPCSLNSDLPGEIDRLISFWLAKDPNYRPNLQTLHVKLSEWAGGMTHMQDTITTGKFSFKLFKR
jgi:serine/threonine protein kinase